MWRNFAVLKFKYRRSNNIPTLAGAEGQTDTFLFHSPYTNNGKRADDIKRLMSELNSYINTHGNNPFMVCNPAKILVTLDSCDKVIDVLKKNVAVDKFLFVVDEFQCLMGDATFKGLSHPS